MSGFTTGGASVRERLLRLRLADDRIALPQRLPLARLDTRTLAGPPPSEFSRLIRAIAGSISKRPMSIAVTGPEEDSTARAEAALHVAAGLVGHAYRVVVVDTDFASPGLAGLVTDPMLEGVIDMLRFGRSCRGVLLSPAPGGPSVLPAGSFPLETPLGLDLDTVRGLVHRVSVHCDVALFVCPLANGNQVNGLVQSCDQVVYAARVRPDGAGRIEAPLAELDRHGVSIAGAVVYVEPEPVAFSVTFPPPPARQVVLPPPAPEAPPQLPAQPVTEPPFVAAPSRPFEVAEAPREELRSIPKSAPEEMRIELPPHPMPDVGVSPEPDAWTPSASRGPLEYEGDSWSGPERRAPRSFRPETPATEGSDDLDLEDTEFAYEDSGRYSRTPLFLLLTLLVLIGGFLGWALWTKRGMERQVGKEWGAEPDGGPTENATPSRPGPPGDLDDGAAAQAVGAVAETTRSASPTNPPAINSAAEPLQRADTLGAPDREASSSSTLVAVGGQRLDQGTATPDAAPKPAASPATHAGQPAARASEPQSHVVPPAPSDASRAVDTGRGPTDDVPAKQPAAAAPGSEAVGAAPAAELPYALHVGSYKTIEKAYEDIANLQKRGFEGRAVRTDLGSKGVWYRVYVGAYPSRAEALAASRAILDLPEYKYAQVVRVPRQ